MVLGTIVAKLVGVCASRRETAARVEVVEAFGAETSFREGAIPMVEAMAKMCGQYIGRNVRITIETLDP